MLILLCSPNLCRAENIFYLEKTITPTPVQNNFKVSAFTSNNSFYFIADEVQKNIFKFDSNGTYIQPFNKNINYDFDSSIFTSLSVDKRMKIYASNPGQNNILVFDSAGYVVKTIGQFGYKNEEFNEPLELAISKEEEIFILEQLNHRIQKLDKNLNSKLIFGSFGLAPQSFFYPQSMALNNNDELLIIDKSARFIKIFDSYGIFLRSINISLNKSYTYQIKTDSHNNIFILNTIKPEIYIYEPNGNLIYNSTLNLTPPVKMHINNLIYITESAPLKIHIYSLLK